MTDVLETRAERYEENEPNVSDSKGAEWLERAAREGSVHTVRVSFADRLGRWRGKRVPVRNFLERAPFSMAFCDGMIVSDVQCDIIEETPFSNYGTGYPDLHVRTSQDDARLVGWLEGEAYVFGRPANHSGQLLDVAPINALAAVLRRLGDLGVATSAAATLGGAFLPVPGATRSLADENIVAGLGNRLLGGLWETGLPVTHLSRGRDEGAFAVAVGPQQTDDLAETLVVVKGAAKELARADGFEAVFMTRRPGAAQPALLDLEVLVSGAEAVSADVLDALLRHARPFLYPSVNAMNAEAAPTEVAGLDGTTFSVRATASSEADPASALAVLLAAVGAAVESHSSIDAQDVGAPVDHLHQAGLLLSTDWTRRWLGADLVDNAVPLFLHEAKLYRSAVTDWEVARYWSAS